MGVARRLNKNEKKAGYLDKKIFSKLEENIAQVKT
jgi:hypothetical protein